MSRLGQEDLFAQERDVSSPQLLAIAIGATGHTSP
jgi:hypothetical protein